MATKEKLLSMLEKGRGSYISGEEIAEKLNISRTAIWKAVRQLEEEGYIISAVTNKGYCLSAENDILSESGIKSYISPENSVFDFEILKEVDSTNSYLFEKAQKGAKDGLVVIAREQKMGKGRYGRSFYSPKDSGIYMSILLKPTDFYAENICKITAMTAVCMCETIKELTQKNMGIKWVNDIYYNDKKVCGILTDASLEVESGLVNFVVLGLGINIYRPTSDFPEELKQSAGYIFEEKQGNIKNKLTGIFLDKFYNYYKNINDECYIEKYISLGFLNGRNVIVKGSMGRKKAKVLKVDKKCRLHVLFEDGKTDILSGGDVSLEL